MNDDSPHKNYATDEQPQEEVSFPASPSVVVAFLQQCLVFLACVFFGISAWIVINSLYSELPEFAKTQPEMHDMSSYLMACQQQGNIFFFLLLQQSGSWLFSKAIRLHMFVLSCVVGNFVLLMIVAFKYDTTVYISNGDRSIVIYICMFLAGFFSASSNVFFYPIVSAFPRLYTNAYSIGLGVASALAGAGALLQDAGEPTLRFSTQTFYLILAGFAFVSILSVAFLMFHPLPRTFQLKQTQETYLQLASFEYPATQRNIFTKDSGNSTFDLVVDNKVVLLFSRGSAKGILETLDLQEARHQTVDLTATPATPSKLRVLTIAKDYMALICAVSVANFGLHQSYLSYACFNYYNSSKVYLWGSSIQFIVDPAVRLLLAFDPISEFQSKKIVLYGATMMVVLAEMFIIILAGQSPYPWGYEDPNGGAAPVVLSAIVGIGYALVSTLVFLMLYKESLPSSSETVCSNSLPKHQLTSVVDMDINGHVDSSEVKQQQVRDTFVDSEHAQNHLISPGNLRLSIVSAGKSPLSINLALDRHASASMENTKKLVHHVRRKSAMALGITEAEQKELESTVFLGDAQLDVPNCAYTPTTDETDTVFTYSSIAQQQPQLSHSFLGLRALPDEQLSQATQEPVEHRIVMNNTQYSNELRSKLYSQAGISIQAGATVGAVISFILVVVCKVLNDPYFR